MRNGFFVFDTHTHIGAARHNGRRYTVEELLRQMDGCGVDRSVIIPFPVVEDYRRAHEELGQAVEAHPDRLVGAASLSPFVGEQEFCSEVKRCRERFGFRALKLQPQYQAVNPLSESSGFVFQAAVENELTLICHTGTGIPFALPSLYMLPARRLPELKIVLAHCGGGMLVGEAIVAALLCPNIYLELSTLMPNQVLEVVAEVPSARLMIGSDLPENVETEIGKILGLGIADEDKRNILAATADRVFGQRC